MNRQPEKNLKSISSQLSLRAESNDHQGKVAAYMGKEMEGLAGMFLEKKMFERAKFFFTRKQYLQALILLHEGLIIAICRKYGLKDGGAYEGYRAVRGYIKKNEDRTFRDRDQVETYYDLVQTRNSAVHGSKAKGTQNFLEQWNHFKDLF